MENFSLDAPDGVDSKAFRTGAKQQPTPKRPLLTVLFMDPSDSERVLADKSHTGCKRRLETYDDIVREEAARFHGRVATSTNDGYLLTFHGSERAMKCAAALGRRLEGFGLGVRNGIHVGECKVHGDELSGLAVRMAARIKEHALEKQIIASRTVKDVIVSTDVNFERIGQIPLDETSDNWELYSVTVY